ncbi:hypothetical protein CLV92_107246 [Kineococcus xinjiangensis]|uniref:Anti-sigma regulatory factor (Ser/Thr protein kinase) n=1 Tax=Kineococcus xinjiangensis TaxID=512762 RepID=A0A2S6IKI2_9ACTN|nr:ATP-binding protein [Kineococcus xinjiangensis]PPK94743.1 hypothetical protein CLV92_107246 [Kineococcus xinjiangensis]
MSEDAELHTVRLLGLPLGIRALFMQHLDGLVRELALIQIGEQAHPDRSLPPRLLEVAAELRGTYAPFQLAAAAGEEYYDVTYTVPVRVGPFAQQLLEVLEEADDFCHREQHLLTLPASEEVVAYRRWVLGQFQRQLAGHPPRPWRRAPCHPSQRLLQAADPVLPTTPPPAAGQVAERAGVQAADDGPSSRPESAAEVVEQPLVMESVASNVATARRYVRRVLTRLDAGALEESAELGVSELITNAMLQAGTSFTVAVRRTSSGRVRIDVTDFSATPVQPRHFGVEATTGRGLQLVASLSGAWGIDELPTSPATGLSTGKTVWFEPSDADTVIDVSEQDWALDLEELR